MLTLTPPIRKNHRMTGRERERRSSFAVDGTVILLYIRLYNVQQICWWWWLLLLMLVYFMYGNCEQSNMRQQAKQQPKFDFVCYH